jgi:hypothetical protein
MRRSLVLASMLSGPLLGGCARAYDSFYRETVRDPMPEPVPPEEVLVVGSPAHLRTPWTELGRYQGHAPTVREAMDAARHTCGRAGADYFVLDVEPFEGRGVWRVVGICAARQGRPLGD